MPSPRRLPTACPDAPLGSPQAALPASARRRCLQRGLLLALSSTTALLGACALPARRASGTDEAGEGYWSGRLALQVESEPPQSWSAGFELMGRPEAGELRIASPLGQVLAQLHWQPGAAVLVRGSDRLQRPSLPALVRELTGTDIPMEGLFAWLRGQAAEVAGWEADLSRQPEGRISARRLQPLPVTTLRLQFEP